MQRIASPQRNIVSKIILPFVMLEMNKIAFSCQNVQLPEWKIRFEYQTLLKQQTIRNKR